MARDYSKDPNRPTIPVGDILRSAGFNPNEKPSTTAVATLQEELKLEREKREAAETAAKGAMAEAEKKYSSKLRKAEQAVKEAEARAAAAERNSGKHQKRVVRSISIDPEIVKIAQTIWAERYGTEKYSFSELVNRLIYDAEKKQ